MSSDSSTATSPARWLWGRARLAVRVVLIMLVVTAPVLIERLDARELRSHADRAVSAPAYLAQRSRVIDELLPAGAGGTLFVSSLPEVRGLAFPRSASIVLSLEGALPSELESAEMHERAHLVHAQHDTLVQAIMAHLAAPAPDEYAATNVLEHFAEMAEEAWTLLAPAEFCLVETADEQLRLTERRVPGTAGFVRYYLRHPVLATHADAAVLGRVADSLIASARDDWERLYAAIEAGRQPDGRLAPLPVPSRRQWLERERRVMRADGTLLGRLHALSLWPSAALLRLLDT